MRLPGSTFLALLRFETAAGRCRIGSNLKLLGLALASVLFVALPIYPRYPQDSLGRLLGEAREAQNRGDFAGAARKYTEAAKLGPNAEIYEKLGLAHFLGNSYSQAVDAFSDALRLDPQRWASHLFLGESLYKLNRFQEGLPHVAIALQLRPDENESRYWLGCINHALGNFKEAIAHLSEATEHDPENVDILYALTETYLDYSTLLVNRLESGAPSAQRRLAIDQQIGGVAAGVLDADSWNRVVDQLRAIAGKYAHVLEGSERDSEALFTLSRTYAYLGQLTAQKVWKLKPGSYRSHELLGQSYDNQKNYTAAITEYREALQIQPNAPGLNYGVGHAYWGMKQLSKAIPELEKELALNPYHPSANYVLGHIYLRLDRPTASAKCSSLLAACRRSSAEFRRSASNGAGHSA